MRNIYQILDTESSIILFICEKAPFQYYCQRPMIKLVMGQRPTQKVGVWVIDDCLFMLRETESIPAFFATKDC